MKESKPYLEKSKSIRVNILIMSPSTKVDPISSIGKGSSKQKSYET